MFKDYLKNNALFINRQYLLGLRYFQFLFDRLKNQEGLNM